ncbi:antitoxin Xre/MbcA/ParS toxin-binding domain-containing protein [Pseudomonas sp. P2757]|uniref:antitoxin Xre/MbcA/ParS toxin-binding domain-containing protein n=1 Tax=unclassified Pseudomonas TaxID=196821 RepID=UPI003B5A22AC
MVLRKSADISDDFFRLAVGNAVYSIVCDMKSPSGLIARKSDNGWIMRIPHLENEPPFYPPRDSWRVNRARCPTEGIAMPQTRAPRLSGLKKVEGKPVEVLLHGREWDRDTMYIIRYTREGFDLRDVVNMISTSELYRESELVQLITEKSVRTVRRLLNSAEPTRLSRQQSMIAFQYAHALESATEVFHDQARAEEWMNKDTKWLNGYRPVELIESSLGYQSVDAYLHRMKYGVYQ